MTVTPIDVDGIANAAELVPRAAEWLDRVWPTEKFGPWYEAIDLDRLALGSACLCVCGQLGAEVARYEGWTVSMNRQIVRHDPLNADDPRMVQGATRRFMYGYDLFVSYLSEYDPDTEDLHLVETLRKYLEVEGKGSVVPEELEYAFIPLTGANEIWTEEITRRRAA